MRGPALFQIDAGLQHVSLKTQRLPASRSMLFWVAVAHGSGCNRRRYSEVAQRCQRISNLTKVVEGALSELRLEGVPRSSGRTEGAPWLRFEGRLRTLRLGLDVERPVGVPVASAALPVLPMPLGYEVVVPARAVRGEHSFVRLGRTVITQMSDFFGLL